MNDPTGTPRLDSGFFLGSQGWPYLLVPFIPAALALNLAGASDAITFFAAALGIVPTAALMSRATEELAARSGPGIGGLLNVTFGNAPELIITLFALGEGLHEVVKATLIGSILGNVLLVLGASMLVGGLRRERQTFNPTVANIQTTMLLVGVAALLMPGLFELGRGHGLPSVDAERVSFGSSVEVLSAVIAALLIVTYLVGLLFSLRTHREVFNPAYEDKSTWGWSTRTAVGMLAIAGVAVAVMSEVLVSSISHASEAVGVSEFFIGAIIVAIVGNAAEHWVAVIVAYKDKMDLSVNIAIGSSAQIGLFVAPIVVLASFFIGPAPMPLVFNGLELGAIVLTVLIANYVSSDGQSNWYEGVLLLTVYAILAVVFAFA